MSYYIILYHIERGEKLTRTTERSARRAEDVDASSSNAPTGVRVILDTNALLLPFQFRINIDQELQRLLGDHEVIVPDFIYHELAHLAPTVKFGPAALRLAAKYPRCETAYDYHPDALKQRDATVDDAMLALAGELDAVVVTNDRELRQRLHEAGISTIGLRSRSHLMLYRLD